MNALESPSTKPYLLRAIYEWCTDNGFTPYIAIWVDDAVQVPMEYVKDNKIVLNISDESCAGLHMGNDSLEFKARFAGVPHDIIVPVSRVMAIYARESSMGIAFSMDDLLPDDTASKKRGEEGAQPPFLSTVPGSLCGPDDDPPPDGPQRRKGRPSLRLVK